MLAQLKKEHPDLYFISLTIEEKDDQDKVSQWLKKAGAESLKAGKSSDTAKSKLHKFAGLEGIAIPAVIMIGKEGVVHKGLESPFSHDDLKTGVAELSAK